MAERRIIQIAVVRVEWHGGSEDSVYALASDATLWSLGVSSDEPDTRGWKQLPPLPQPEPSNG